MEVSILGVWEEGWIMWPREELAETSLADPSSALRFLFDFTVVTDLGLHVFGD